MWQYNYTPDPDNPNDSLMHYGVKGMKWDQAKRKAKGLLTVGPNAARQRYIQSKNARIGIQSKTGKTINSAATKTYRYSGADANRNLSSRQQLNLKKAKYQQRARQLSGKAKRALNSENRAKAALAGINAAEKGAKAARRATTRATNKAKRYIDTQIKVARQKRKNKNMAKKYKGTTQAKNNK